jgi:hypothetical protein
MAAGVATTLMMVAKRLASATTTLRSLTTFQGGPFRALGGQTSALTSYTVVNTRSGINTTGPGSVGILV